MPQAITKDDTISNIYYDLEDGYGSVKIHLNKHKRLTLLYY